MRKFFIINFWILYLGLISANTYYVSSTATGGGNGSANNPWTIWQAVENVNPGDTIQVATGAYNISNSRLTFSRNGTSSAPIVWIGHISTWDYNPHNLTCDGDSSTLFWSNSTVSDRFRANAAYNEYHKLVFRQDFPETMISVNDHHITFNAIATKYPSNVGSGSNHYLTTGYNDNSHNLTIKNSSFSQAPRCHTWIQSGTTAPYDILIDNNIYYHMTRHNAIQVMPQTTGSGGPTNPPHIRRITIRNNYFEDNGYQILMFRHTDSLYFYNNVSYDGPFIKSEQELSTVASETYGSVFAFNTFYIFNTEWLIQNQQSAGIIWKNNLLYTNTTQDELYRYLCSYPEYDLHEGAEYDYNLYYVSSNPSLSNVRIPIGEASCSGGEVNWNTWKSVYGQDNNTITGQIPTFMSVSNKNFRPLNENSPQVGAGTPILGIITDKDGNPRDPNNPTIGAYEFQGDGNFIEINEGWNYISVPKLSQNMTADFLLPTRTSPVYKYNENGYQTVNNLENGKGYIVDFDYPQYIFIEGESVNFPIPVSEGWNLIGPFDENIPVSQITTIPSGIIISNFWEYNETGFVGTSLLKIGKGYWIKVTSNGVINLNGGSLGKNVNIEHVAKVENDWGRIIITDSKGKNITLYAATEDSPNGVVNSPNGEASIDLELYELPPIPLEGMFDVRFSGGKFTEDLSNEKTILISSEEYPITIRAEGLNLGIRYKINEEIKNEELSDGEKLRITNNNITSIEVSTKMSESIPASYELYQNYPNPFNPNTIISWQSPVGSWQTLKVYDILGNEVAKLVDEYKTAGSYEVEFSAEKYSSGVYFYTLQAGAYIQTRKMVLIK